MTCRRAFLLVEPTGGRPRRTLMNPFFRVLACTMLFATFGWAQTACDVTNDGTVNAADLNSLVNMLLGVSPCAAGVQGIGGCNVIAVQRVINAATGGKCSTTPTASSHSVTVTWVASITPNVAGYNLYRTDSSSGNYSKVNSSMIGGTSYTDTTVQAGQTYYYAATAIDSSNDESAFSTSVTASVPTP
jgi:hypothetical protein